MAKSTGEEVKGGPDTVRLATAVVKESEKEAPGG